MRVVLPAEPIRARLQPKLPSVDVEVWLSDISVRSTA
jgi:hypothetical protein